MQPNVLDSTLATDFAADMAADNTAMYQTSIILNQLKQAMTDEQLARWAFTYIRKRTQTGPEAKSSAGGAGRSSMTTPGSSRWA